MQLSHTPARLSATFDDPNLVVSAGLVPAMRLMDRVGVRQLAEEHVRVAGDRGANPGAKVMTVVAGMLAGADSIDDLNVLRHAGMGTVFTETRAPSTIGSFLRGFTFGHVRQLDAVASRTLLGLAQATPLLPGIGEGAVIDIDDTIVEVFGPGKQGAEHGYTKVRGLNAQLATIKTTGCAPVIAATRLRRGAAHSAHGAPRMLTEAIATARRAGACGPILVRADSAYCSSQIVRTIIKTGARFSVGMPLNSRVRTAIAGIPETAWTTIEYPWKIPDPDTGELISAADIAEVDYTAFTSLTVDEQVAARLIVRRIPERNRNKQQDPLFPAFRYHAIFTNNPAPLTEAEPAHRGHAVIEQVFSDLKASALAHLPSGNVHANAAWLVCAAITFNTTRALGTLAAGRLARATTPTIRARIINIPARISRSARRLHLHLPEGWTWEAPWQQTWTAVMTT